MKSLADWVVRSAWPIIVVFVAVSLAFAIPLRNVEIDPEIKNQLPEDMPARQNVAAIEQRFGGSELVMVVFTAPDVLDRAVLEQVRGVTEAMGGIETIDRVMSPFTLTDIRGEGGLMTVEPAIPDLPTSADDRAALRERLEDNELVYGNVVAKDFSAISVIGLLSTNAKDSDTIAAVQQAIASAPGPAQVVIGGMPDVREHVSEDIRSDIRRFAPVGFVLIVLFLFVTLRQPRGVFIPFTVQLAAILVSMGLIPLLGWKIQMVTVVLPVMLLAVGNDHAIHVIARFQEENVPGRTASAGELAKRVLLELGVPVMAAGFTTAAGMLCLLTHIVVPARQLGVLACVGVIVAIVGSLTYAPAVLSRLPVPKPLKTLGEGEIGQRGAGGGMERLLRGLAQLVVSRPRTMVVASLALAAVSSLGLPLLKVDTNPINYYPSTAPVAVTAEAINQHFGGSTEIAVMVEGDMRDPAVLAELQGLEDELQRMPQVGYTMSIAQVVRAMNHAVMGDAPGADALPDTREKVAQLYELYGMGGDPADLERMVDFEFQHALVTARVSSLSTGDIAAVVDDIEAYTDQHFQGMPVTIGGFGAVFADLVDAVVNGQITSLTLSMIVVGLLCALSFWSVEAGLYCLVPLLLAAPSLFGLMGWWGIELNVVTAMLSSIMVGVGVDYTVHFLWRYREERRTGTDPSTAAYRTLVSAGRGIVFNALSVVFGFSILLLSNFLPVRFFGFLVVVSIGGCLLGAMILMPPLMILLKPRFCEPPVAAGEVTAARS
ncbi:MAG: MMPL family transporter [Myxococcota bacterium]